MTPGEVAVETVPCPLCGVRRDGKRPFASGFDFEYATSAREFHFLRCAPCDLLYLSPRPNAASLARIYPTDYYSFVGEDEGTGPVGTLRRIWELRKVEDYVRWVGPGPRKILDVGCGRGRLLELFREAAGRDWDLHGIELDPAAVQVARQRGFTVERTTIEEYDPPVTFDLIVLQHVDQPRRVLQKLARLLSPSGTLVLETPNLDGWDFRLFRRRLWGGYHFPRHWTLFSRAALRRLVEEAGLVVRDQRSLMSLSFWSWSIHHALLVHRLPASLVRRCRPPSAVLLALTTPLEILQRVLRGQSSNQRLVAVRPPA
jgi:SAM-dependent methyltransferase